MNEMTQQFTNPMQPRAALIAYECENDNRDSDYYLELRTIDRQGRMAEGMPVTHEFINAIVQGYSTVQTGIAHGAVPPNMLYCDVRPGRERYVWFNPPGRRTMYFTSALNIPDGEYHVPGVVYHVKDEKLMIYAYTGNSPSPDSVLYEAPFFNIYGYGVCMGSAKLDKPEDPSHKQMLEYWEKKFWNSKFSHLGAGNPVDGNLVLLTKKAKNAPFPENKLKPLKIILKDLLK